ncbi:MAG: glycolate oxidase subunit GlcE [Rhodovarius sp.]|nr:glycolate oxidase subunit GlcE [Rhodovarius sp.]MDW8314336.1 glycolate oxidase subunit GlcE [Rhodovarius sp.]
MSVAEAPGSEAALCEAIAAAHAAREPIAIEGHGTKRAMLRPVQAARLLSTRGLSGITLYRPAELVISARAGTPLPEIEAALAEHRQMLIAEPPDPRPLFGGELPATLGGVVAANLSGPRRIAWGGMRDHVLGIRAITGDGQLFRSGGRVLKNVTGLDLCKLLTGSFGTLGVLTEITLKVLPAPEATVTLAVEVPDIAAGVAVLSAGLGSPFGVTGAALWGGRALLRLEEVAESVRYRAGRLQALLAAHGPVRLIEAEESRALWRAIRDGQALAAAQEEAIWRISIAPSEAPRVAAALPWARLLFDWGGGLIWVAGPAEVARHRAVVAAAAGGSWMLFRAPDALRAAVEVIPPDPPALAAISARVKAVFDPAGVLNPGRMRAGG